MHSHIVDIELVDGSRIRIGVKSQWDKEPWVAEEILRKLYLPTTSSTYISTRQILSITFIKD